MMWLAKRILPFLVVLAVHGVSEIGHASEAERPVGAFQDGLVQVMKDAEKLGVKGRYDALRPLVADNFNMPFMGALAAGRAWKSATDDQKKRFVTAFERSSVATLATLFDGYCGETFERVGERPGPQGIIFVDTILHLTNPTDQVKLTYVAKEFSEGWHLIDVIVDGGISELKVRISEYNQTINDSGMEGLIKLLENKADELLR